jgi:hypothetical protein
MGGSAQAGFYLTHTYSSVPGIPHFRVVNLFATNDGIGTGTDIQGLLANFATAPTVWSYLVDEDGAAEADLQGKVAQPWASWVRLRPSPPEAFFQPLPAASDPRWTEGMTSFSVAMSTVRPPQTNTRQIARMVFANEILLSTHMQIGGSAGVAHSLTGQIGYYGAPAPPYWISIDRPVKVMHVPHPTRPTEFGPVTVLSTSLSSLPPQPITVESVSPNLLNNIEWITDEPARKVFRLVNLTAEDWRVSTIFFTVPDGVGGTDRQAFTLIMPEPATLGVLGLVLGLGALRTRRS